MKDITNWRSLFDEAQTAHAFDFEWCKGYAAYNSDFEWDETKSKMWKLGFLYGYLKRNSNIKLH